MMDIATWLLSLNVSQFKQVKKVVRTVAGVGIHASDALKMIHEAHEIRRETHRRYKPSQPDPSLYA